MLDRLVEDSKRHITAMESATLRGLELPPEEAERLASYAAAHPDETAYHALLGLRRASAPQYRALPASAKAAILCGALTTQTYLNDWGYLHPREPHDGEAAKALAELGEAATRCLTPLLDDCRPASLFGGEEATMSGTYKYRRCDFAYRYLSQILGSTPGFDPDPERRDNDIALLKKKLTGL